MACRVAGATAAATGTCVVKRRNARNGFIADINAPNAFVSTLRYVVFYWYDVLNQFDILFASFQSNYVANGPAVKAHRRYIQLPDPTPNPISPDLARSNPVRPDPPQSYPIQTDHTRHSKSEHLF